MNESPIKIYKMVVLKKSKYFYYQLLGFVQSYFEKQWKLKWNKCLSNLIMGNNASSNKNT